MSPDEVNVVVEQLVNYWVWALLSLVGAMWFKDLATGIAKGIMFRFNPLVKEGEQVIIDGEKAIVVKIGLTNTIFGIHNGVGYIWRIVNNQRLGSIKLAKIVEPYSEEHIKEHEHI